MLFYSYDVFCGNLECEKEEKPLTKKVRPNVCLVLYVVRYCMFVILENIAYVCNVCLCGKKTLNGIYC